jgi:hypothetical protein
MSHSGGLKGYRDDTYGRKGTKRATTKVILLCLTTLTDLHDAVHCFDCEILICCLTVLSSQFQYKFSYTISWHPRPFVICLRYYPILRIPVAECSKAWVCGSSFPGIAGSNPAGPRTSASSECCLLSGRGLCDELIAGPGVSHRVWHVLCVCVCCVCVVCCVIVMPW